MNQSDQLPEGSGELPPAKMSIADWGRSLRQWAEELSTALGFNQPEPQGQFYVRAGRERPWEYGLYQDDHYGAPRLCGLFLYRSMAERVAALLNGEEE